jgi:tetratricopeptide (TPR) repeat protein
VSTTDEGLRLKITGTALHVHFGEEGPAVSLNTALYPISDTRLATDVTDAVLQRTPGEEGLTLAWKDTSYALSPVDPDTQSPIEHIRAGQFERGAEGLHAALDGGMKVGTNAVGASLTMRVDELIQQDRAEEALRFGKLAVAFWPNAWSSHADLAEAYAALGRDEDALRALQPVRRLNPPQYGEMLEYLDLNGVVDE